MPLRFPVACLHVQFSLQYRGNAEAAIAEAQGRVELIEIGEGRYPAADGMSGRCRLQCNHLVGTIKHAIARRAQPALHCDVIVTDR